MTSTKLRTIGATLAAGGGLAWLVKLMIIAATESGKTYDGNLGTFVFYLLGVGLLAAAGATLAAGLAGERHLSLRVLAGAVGVVAVMLSFSLLDALAQAVVGDAGPAWFPEESGILLTAVAWLAAGLVLLRAAGSAPAGLGGGGNAPG